MKLNEALNEFKKEIAKNNYEFTQANIICEVCRNSENVEVHHIYARIWTFLILSVRMHDINNLKLVCNNCHQKIWHAATDILNNTTPMEPKYSKSNNITEIEVLNLLTKIKNENPEKIEKLKFLIRKYMVSESDNENEEKFLPTSKIEYWVNRFLLLCMGTDELFQKYKESKNSTPNESSIFECLKEYYDINVRDDDFNPIETYEKFLTYFRIKDEYFNTSYKTEFLQVGNELLNRVKEEQNKYFSSQL